MSVAMVVRHVAVLFVRGLVQTNEENASFVVSLRFLLCRCVRVRHCDLFFRHCPPFFVIAILFFVIAILFFVVAIVAFVIAVFFVLSLPCFFLAAIGVLSSLIMDFLRLIFWLQRLFKCCSCCSLRKT